MPRFYSLCFLLLSLIPAFQAFAETKTVTPEDNLTNIINGAASGDTIRFYPGTYEINLIIENKTLMLEGINTQNTILKSADTSLPVITLINASNTHIRRFTFSTSDIGIQVGDVNSDIIISNNVFRVGVNSTALIIDENTSSNINQNTFYGNAVNLANQSPSTTMTHNIFANYDNLLSDIMPSNFTYNCIERNTSNIDDSNKLDTQASFVETDIDTHDFHLQEDSHCRDITNTSVESDYDDAGAYGGVEFDQSPESMTIASIDSSNPNSVVIQWAASEDYQVDGYKLYYHSDEIYSSTYHRYTNKDERDESLLSSDTGTETRVTLSTLTTQASEILTPVLSNVLPGKNTLTLTWELVDDATSYIVHYDSDNTDAAQIDVGNTNSYTIPNLTNHVPYTVWVEAKNQLRYYFQVAAYINDSDNDFAESQFTKADKIIDRGDPVFSDISNTITMQPEAIVAYPALPNEGCFIATAAFGYYSSAQVKTLRTFRDNHLLTTELGRSFVTLYYRYSPPIADMISQQSWLKVVTRAMLYPLIFVAESFESYPSLLLITLIVIFFLLPLIIGNLIFRFFYPRVSI